ncbi:MAG: GNAT family N-acetyltransferase [Pelagibaca sp.]
MSPIDKVRTLPSGRLLRLDRLRSDGILTPEELAYCKSEAIPVAYDPLQSGWILADGIDDLNPKEVIDPRHPRSKRDHRDIALHLHLRPWEASDAPRLTELLADRVLWETLPEPYPDPFTVDLAETLIEIANEGAHHHVFAVLHDDVPVGQVRLLRNAGGPHAGVSELSYWIGRPYWGQGMAGAAVVAFVNQSFDEDASLNTLIARVKDGNMASRRVLGKAGFQLVGTAGGGWSLFRRSR